MKPFLLAILSTGTLLAVGCGGDDTAAFDAGGQDAPAAFKIVSGSYMVTQPTVATTDTCKWGTVDFFVAGSLDNPTTVTNTQGTIAIGPLKGMPPQPQFGTGPVRGNVGTLTRMNTSSLAPPSTCTYTKTVTSNVTVTADNNIAIDYSEQDSNFTMCPDVTTTTCTLAYTFSVSM